MPTNTFIPAQRSHWIPAFAGMTKVFALAVSRLANFPKSLPRFEPDGNCAGMTKVFELAATRPATVASDRKALHATSLNPIAKSKPSI